MNVSAASSSNYAYTGNSGPTAAQLQKQIAKVMKDISAETSSSDDAKTKTLKLQALQLQVMQLEIQLQQLQMKKQQAAQSTPAGNQTSSAYRTAAAANAETDSSASA